MKMQKPTYQNMMTLARFMRRELDDDIGETDMMAITIKPVGNKWKMYAVDVDDLPGYMTDDFGFMIGMMNCGYPYSTKDYFNFVRSCWNNEQRLINGAVYVENEWMFQSPDGSLHEWKKVIDSYEYACDHPSCASDEKHDHLAMYLASNQAE